MYILFTYSKTQAKSRNFINFCEFNKSKFPERDPDPQPSNLIKIRLVKLFLYDTLYKI